MNEIDFSRVDKGLDPIGDFSIVIFLGDERQGGKQV